MLRSFPSMTLTAALPDVGTSTPAEVFLMVSEKMDAMEEAKALLLAVATHRL